jgi:hypothetical protein
MQDRPEVQDRAEADLANTILDFLMILHLARRGACKACGTREAACLKKASTEAVVSAKMATDAGSTESRSWKTQQSFKTPAFQAAQVM